MRTFVARLTLAAVCGALALFSAPALCLYATPATQRVPVARLITNVQAVVDKNPDNLRAVLNLARTHAMAYSLKADMAHIETVRPYPGYWITKSEARLRDPPITAAQYVCSPDDGAGKPVYFDKVAQTNDPAQLQAAQGHLAQALAGYRRAAQLAPENLVVQLGLAWLTQQAGNKQEAVRSYRSIVAEAWKLEQGRTKGIDYLMLHPAKPRLHL